jgi:hypothetical protein
MRALLILCLAAASAIAQNPQGAYGAFSQSGNLGLFTNSDDVGDPPLKGSAIYNPAAKTYTITGSGTDIWGKSDQFHFVWREMWGDFEVAAKARFLTNGIDHRKAVIMMRKTLEADSPFVQLALHGNGMPSVQFRKAKNDDTETLDLPIEGPGVFRLKLTRRGNAVTVWVAKDGRPLREFGTTQTEIGSPVLVGLGVSSHTQTATNTVLFSDVTVEQLGSVGK